VTSSNSATLPDPDFSWDPNANPPIADLRPHRAKSYRLEPEILGNKLVVHNYGHGGAGITMSWGCAHEVVDIISSRGFIQNQSVAVLGSGRHGIDGRDIAGAAKPTCNDLCQSFSTSYDIERRRWAMGTITRRT
jgi:hypothetical protein